MKQALHRLGITEERVEHWLGRPCGCAERAAKLDELDMWARQALRLSADRARKFAEDLLSRA